MKKARKAIIVVLLLILVLSMIVSCNSEMSVSKSRIKEDIILTGVTECIIDNKKEVLHIERWNIEERKTTDTTDNITCYVVLASKDQKYLRYAYCYLDYRKYEQGWQLDRADWEYDYENIYYKRL